MKRAQNFVVYVENTKQVIRHTSTKAAAGASAAAYNRRHKTVDGRKALYCTSDEFHQINGFTTVKNLMSGKDVLIRESDVGGCCDPSTERYWSM